MMFYFDLAVQNQKALNLNPKITTWPYDDKVLVFKWFHMISINSWKNEKKGNVPYLL